MRSRPVFFKWCSHHHFRFSRDQAYRLAIDVRIARRGVGEFVRKFDGVGVRGDCPLAAVHDLILPEGVVLFRVLAQHTDADFDKGAAHLGLVKTQGAFVRMEFFHRSHNRAGG